MAMSLWPHFLAHPVYIAIIYRVAQKVVRCSTHHIFGIVQDKMKRISRFKRAATNFAAW